MNVLVCNLILDIQEHLVLAASFFQTFTLCTPVPTPLWVIPVSCKHLLPVSPYNLSAEQGPSLCLEQIFDSKVIAASSGH